MRISSIINAAMLAVIAGPCIAQTCQTLEQRSALLTSKNIFNVIEDSGCYVVRSDLLNHYSDNAFSRNPPEETMLRISAPDVKIDLGGHLLLGEARWTTGMEIDNNLNHKKVRVKNGRIITMRMPAVSFTSLQYGPMLSLFEDFETKASGVEKLRAFKFDVSTQPRAASAYPRTEHEVSSIFLQSERSNYVIGMQGAGNVVMRSKIVAINSDSGIYLFGPNSVIEDCIIIFKNYRGTQASAAPVRIHRGDGTIIRNNVIVIEGGRERELPAISIIDSKNVLVENNKLYGTGLMVKKWDEQSEVREVHNQRLRLSEFSADTIPMSIP